MGHLLTPRTGWENERLASYLLSRFSFVAQPASIADDLGSDFFCTIFEIIQDQAGRDRLEARRSFAIQVKSSVDAVPADNKIPYLLGLELPFFIGVVSQSPAEMHLYSAEFLPLLFAEVGKPNRLWLTLVPQSGFDPSSYYERVNHLEIKLRCPEVLTLGINDERSALTPKVKTLLDICARVQSNIAARVSEEHIYDDGRGGLRILAGPGSAQYFRENLRKRLAEYFYNLGWILENQPDKFNMAEFQEFERFYHGLENLYGSLPPYVSLAYAALKHKVGPPD